MTWDVARVTQALAVERQAGYANLQGREYRFYEFLLEQMSLVAVDWLPKPVMNQWQVLLAEMRHYPQLTHEQREALVERIAALVPQIRIPGAPSPRVQETQPPPPSEATLIAELDVLKPHQKRYLQQLGLNTLGDVLHYYPRTYVDYSQRSLIKDLAAGKTVTVIAEIRSFRCFTSPKNPQLTIAEWWVADGSGRMKINRYYMGKRYAHKGWQEQQRKLYKPGVLVAIFGLVKQTKFSQTLHEPELQIIDEESASKGKIVPVYGLRADLKASWVRQAIHSVLPLVKSWPDPLPEALKKQYDLVALGTAYQGIHAPRYSEELKRARTRLVFDELFYLQLSFLQRRRQNQRHPSPVLAVEGQLLQKFRAQLPFPLTHAQERVIQEILQDLQKPQPMQRLVQGDVGSGKTVVAVMAMLAAIEAGYQAALMAPTEVLAEQHYQKLLHWLTPLHLPVELLTGSTKAGQRRQILAQLATGEIPLVIGTHALIQEDVNFRNLGLVIIDEQHRFGVEQRSLLQQKGSEPHVLAMTATPIPRTLALTIHGDLDVSQIDELPPGRQKMTTTVIPGSQRHSAYDLIRREVVQGRQAYIILPLIEESEKLEAKAATAEYQKLQEMTFKNYRLGLLHGRQTTAEKDATLRAFRDGEIQILVSTTVVEVGVDVPNATVMMIENAERFGLAQLHQLRGRVGRGSHPSHCILVTQGKGEDTQQRLQVLTQSQDGFLIADMDLRLRGPGEILGTRQAGLPDLALTSLIEDQDILETARQAAEQLLQNDPELTHYPQLKNALCRYLERLTGRVVLS